jgi:hypothetical protein
MSRLSGAPRGSPKTIIAPSITRLHGPVRVLRDADIGIGEVLLGFCIGLGRGRGGIPSAFPEPLGVPPLLRLGRCFELSLASAATSLRAKQSIRSPHASLASAAITSKLTAPNFERLARTPCFVCLFGILRHQCFELCAALQ